MDRVTKEVRSRVMSAIRSTNTKPEIMLRKALWAKGHRFRAHYSKEKVDIALPRKKVAILVDGCFWHQCPKHSHIPKSNRKFWIAKLRKNTKRDIAQNKRLKADGWKVVRVWEHDIKNNLNRCCSKIQQIITKRGSG